MKSKAGSGPGAGQAKWIGARGWHLTHGTHNAHIQSMTLTDHTDKSYIEIAYRIPGKGGWHRKVFEAPSAPAVEKKMSDFLGALREREGDDIEVSFTRDR